MSYEEIYDDWSDAYARMYSSEDDIVEEAKNSIGRFLQKNFPLDVYWRLGVGLGS